MSKVTDIIKKTEPMNYRYRRRRNSGQSHRKYSQDLIEENLSNQNKKREREMPVHAQESYRTPNRPDPKISSPHQVAAKILNV